MQAMATQQDATSQNLSHAMKPGFRREIMRFTGIGQQNDIVGPTSSLHSDFTQGTMENTGGVLDVALDGPGFFSVQGPNGPLFTRSGVFQLNSQGQIVTPEGLAVLGTGGPIAVPLTTDKIEIFNDGSVIADGITVDQLSATAFENPAELQRVGSTYFQPLPDSKRAQVPTGFRQGYRELSNTTQVHEMVQMITGARQFDAAQRALRQIAETISLNTRPK
jgi:flagellar basal body rod protein FlgG